MKLVSKLDTLMEKRNINQDELAEKAGVTNGFISQLSQLDGYHINVNHLNKVINALDIDDISQLIELKED